MSEDESGYLRAALDRAHAWIAAMSDGRYHQAQICLNGHVITAYFDVNQERRQKFCDRCGDETVAYCPSCNSRIRGDYVVPGVIGFYEYHPPAYCADCSSAFPWTVRRLEAARELALELDQLSDDEREQLQAALPDLVRDVPRTQVAAGRFKRLVAKAGGEAATAFREILVDVASETAKKVIWGP